MTRRWQPSKRRWKARYRMGKPIPLWAVADHGLSGFVAPWQWDASRAVYWGTPT